MKKLDDKKNEFNVFSRQVQVLMTQKQSLEVEINKNIIDELETLKQTFVKGSEDYVYT